MKRFLIPLFVFFVLALAGEAALARDNLSLQFNLHTQASREDKDVRISWTGSELLVEALRENFLWFQYFDLPKNSRFRNVFSLETEVTLVKDRGVAGLALGNREIDLVFYVYRHDRNGYAYISTADSDQTHFVAEQRFPYPSTPFTLGVRYDVDQGRFVGLVNGQEVSSISSKAFPRLTRISSVTAVALVGGSRYDQPSGTVGFGTLHLEAE